MAEIFGDVSVRLDEHVALVEIRRPPTNHLDVALVADLASAYSAATERRARVIVLCTEGKHFCAGADFGSIPEGETIGSMGRALYRQAIPLFGVEIPVIAAVQGSAVGGGLGLACSADFRVGSVDTRFWANFARLGLHQGFGLSATLPELIGVQRAAELLFTGRRIGGAVAAEIGLLDKLVDEPSRVREAAVEFAREIAESAPLAIREIRRTLRRGLVDRVIAATERENDAQAILLDTEDHLEGVAAMRDRRTPHFQAR